VTVSPSACVELRTEDVTIAEQLQRSCHCGRAGNMYRKSFESRAFVRQVSSALGDRAPCLQQSLVSPEGIAAAVDLKNIPIQSP
jgi:hypothetical protein